MYAFQRKASLAKLETSDRIVYINLALRANLEGSEHFDMTARELAFYTGLSEKTVHRSKQRLKNLGYIDFKGQHILDMSRFVSDESPVSVSKKSPTPPKKKNKLHEQTPKDAGAREKETERPHTVTIGEKPKWY